MSACWLFIHRLSPPKWQGGWRHWPNVQVKSHTILVRSGENKSFEFSKWLIKCPSLAIRLIVVYQPTYSKEPPISPAIFNEELVMKTHVTRRRWQHSTTPRCEKSRMIMPWRRLRLWKRNWLCLGTTMKSKVSNVTDGRQNDSDCSTEVTP